MASVRSLPAELERVGSWTPVALTDSCDYCFEDQAERIRTGRGPVRGRMPSSWRYVGVVAGREVTLLVCEGHRGEVLADELRAAVCR